MKHLTDNAHQFFYKNLAGNMLKEVKETAEFKLMFDYLFPMRRYMALATMVASDGLSKFIPEPTDVLEETKSSLQLIIDTLINSADYKHVPDPIANMLANNIVASERGTRGKELDMTKEILKIVLMTPLLVLKGFVEITDPAVITAKLVIDIANAIQQATLAAVKQGIATAKQIIQAGIDAANQIMQQVEIQISVGVGFAEAAVAMLPTITIPPTPAEPAAMLSNGETIKNGTGAPLNFEVLGPGSYTFGIGESMIAFGGKGPSDVLINNTGGLLTIEVLVGGKSADPPKIVEIPVTESKIVKLEKDGEYKLQPGESAADPNNPGTAEGFEEGGDFVLSELVTLGGPPKEEGKPIDEWIFETKDPPTFGGDEAVEKQWNDFKKEFNKLKALKEEYADAKALAYIPVDESGKLLPPEHEDYIEKAGTLIKKKDAIERDAEVAIRKAENTMKDIFTSPYLLPGMWAALFPSIIPLGGGINPWPGTIPSTFPGMIYIALLFIDAIEEKMHDEQQKLSDPKCEDQL